MPVPRTSARRPTRAVELLEGRRLLSSTLFSTGFEQANVAPAAFTSVGYQPGAFLNGQPGAGVKFTSAVTPGAGGAGAGSAAVVAYAGSGLTGSASNAQYVQLDDLSGISRTASAYYFPNLGSIAPVAAGTPVVDVVATVAAVDGSNGAAFGLSAFDGTAAQNLVADVQVNAATGAVSVDNGARPTGFTQVVSSVTFDAYELRLNYATQTYDVYEAGAGATAFTNEIAAGVPFETAATTFSTAGMDTESLATSGTATGLGLIDDLSITANAGATGAKLTGTLIGTTGSYQNDGNTIAKAVDGSTSTFFDSTVASGNWVGYDLAAADTVTSVSFAPRNGYESRMVGGVFQGSNSPQFTSGVTTLYTVTAAPKAGTLTTATVTNTSAFRYVRYLAPNNSYGNVAEVNFFGTAGEATTGPTKLTGTTVGTVGSYKGSGNTIAKATDGNLSTFFDGPTANGNVVGLDLGTQQQITAIAFAPRSGYDSRMVGGVFQVSTTADFSSGVTTVYTVTSAPADGKLTTVTLSSPVVGRYVRYLSPNGSEGDVAEVQFFE